MDRQLLRNEWKERIAHYQSSNMTQKEWCEEHHLNYSQFHYWMRKLKTEENPSNTKTQWLPVDIMDQVVDETETSMFVHVGGVLIEVKPHFNPNLLKQLVRTLSET